MLDKLIALFSSSEKAVEVAGAAINGVIDGLFGWIPNRKSEEETKRKLEEVKLALAQGQFEIDKMRIAAEQVIQQALLQIESLSFQLRQAVAATKAGQFIIYGFGGISILQLFFNGVVCPFFPALTAMPIAAEQWYLLFGVMGLEKLLEFKTRGASKQEGSK